MKNESISTKKIVMTAFFAAIIYLGIQSFRIPLPAAVGTPFLHFGHIFVMLAVLMLGPKLSTVAGVLGLLVGGLSAGFVLAIFMANSGGAWDNAKKYIEEGHFGGKGSEVHKATVVGDTVGDPFKDTSGPSLNILIKLMSMVSIVMAGLTVSWSLF